jgi:uncharacterized protein (DUF427 family)
MAVQMSTVLGAAMSELRVQPVEWRVRARHGDTTVVDTTAARLVWEPRRVVSSYAVLVTDVAARLVPRTDGRHVRPDVNALPPVLSPRNPFAVHSGAGTAADLELGEAVLPAAAYVLDDPDLDGYVVLDWEAFDTWFEEDQEAVGHPREPHHRIRCLPSSRHVVVEIEGDVLADTQRPTLLVETNLPPRWYLPREDVRMDRLTASGTRTTCAYKGHASYWSTTVDGTAFDDIAWSYEEPRRDAEEVRGMVCFFAEHTDTVVDGERVGRPVTGWSR